MVRSTAFVAYPVRIVAMNRSAKHRCWQIEIVDIVAGSLPVNGSNVLAIVVLFIKDGRSCTGLKTQMRFMRRKHGGFSHK